MPTSLPPSQVGYPTSLSYRDLVTRTGPDDTGDNLYWIGPELPPFGDIVYMNTGEYALWPKFLVAVIAEGNGDEFCLDTRYPDASGEYPLVEWDHESTTRTRPNSIASLTVWWTPFIRLERTAVSLRDWR